MFVRSCVFLLPHLIESTSTKGVKTIWLSTARLNTGMNDTLGDNTIHAKTTPIVFYGIESKEAKFVFTMNREEEPFEWYQNYQGPCTTACDSNESCQAHDSHKQTQNL